MNDIASIESRIDTYIHEQGLTRGSRLPPDRDLAAQLLCEEDALVKALQAAEKKLKVTRDEQGWRVIPLDLRDHHPFSFTKSAESSGRGLMTDVLEVSVRLPMADKKHPFYEVERTAQGALGLASDSPFLIIVRFRLLEGKPSALHRAYLDPARFPKDFPKHDFKTESLIDLYIRYGYKLLSRDTVLTARLAYVYETNLLNRGYQSEPHERVVLDAEQRLYAQDPKTGDRFVLEYLKASYLEDWKYEIKNRPAGSA